MEQTIKFMKMIKDEDSTIEFNNLSQKVSWKETQDGKTDYYFCGGVKKGMDVRCKDSDIINKNYVFIDLDYRSHFKNKYGTIITNDDIKDLGYWVGLTLSGDEVFSNYAAIIYSGNGIHIYYVGDTIIADVNARQKGMTILMKEFDKRFGQELDIECDKANKNIGRISRLPGSYNHSMKFKYGLEPQKVEFLELINRKSNLVDLVYWFSEIYDKEQEQLLKESKEEYKKKAEEYKAEGNNVFEEINKINLQDIICADYKLKIGKNPKMFKGDREGYEGIVYYSDNNTIWNGGSHHLSFGKIGDVYNTFSYIRQKNGFTNAETFDYFKTKYPHIADIAKGDSSIDF